MAIIKLGAIVTGIAGKIGGTVFRRSPMGQIASNRGTCGVGNMAGCKGEIDCACHPWATWHGQIWGYRNNNMNNVPSWQQVVDNCDFMEMAMVANMWKDLTQVERTTWNSGAPNFPRKNKFGDTYTPSGFQLFTEFNSQLNIISQPSIRVCPSPATIVDSTNPEYKAFSDNILMLTLSEVVGDGYAVEVMATACVSPGRKNSAGGFKLIAVFDAQAGTVIDLSYIYLYLFGNINAGQKIQVKYRTIEKISGISNAWRTVSVLVEAGIDMSSTFVVGASIGCGAPHKAVIWTTINAASVSLLRQGVEVETDLNGSHCETHNEMLTYTLIVTGANGEVSIKYITSFFP